LSTPYSFEQSKDAIASLAKHFATNRVQYLAATYKEAHARQEFIDPLFVALNWDVHNSQQAAPDYRGVVVEDSQDVEGHKKAPDYAFRVGWDRKFFAEAKKPGVDLKNDAGPVYQLRRYAWSAKLPLSILTDFEELAFYDSRIRPAEKDKAGVARVNYLRYEEYPDRWQEICDVFSRGSVLDGSFDQFVQVSRGKHGTSEVDAEFLKEIEGWRNVLAKNIAIRNPRLTIDEMNDAVQRTIDRIIFFRMAEDRGIEEYGRLQRLAEVEGIYAALLALSRQADAHYNSGLFDFSKTGDRITPGLKVDDKALKPILADLYYPQSPYEFSVMPAEILGNVYEQFLGKVIRLTAAHQAKVEEKPEVKKAGGVYYTPTYIVEYIVKNTVGKQVEGRSPKQLKGFRVLDMACGSGSFLLGAYQYLLDYYRQWYSEHTPEKHSEAVWQQGEVWRLTTAEKKCILIEHIFGVDIDRQAVEVTKLSLLLKVLEGENDETLGKQLVLLQERALPNLDRNIKCGNSLIGPDYFSGQLFPGPDELRRVNPFDWAAEFPEAMQAGGFDCVIGNPPHIRIQTLAPGEIEYFSKCYETTVGNYDIYCPFLEKAVKLLTPNGYASYILPHRFFKTDYGDGLRTFLSKRKNVIEILDFDGFMVFPGASINTCIIILSAMESESFKFSQARFVRRQIGEMPQVMMRIDDTAQADAPDLVIDILNTTSLGSAPWTFILPKEETLWQLLTGGKRVLGEISEQIFQGLKTGSDSVFSVRVITPGKKTSTIRCEENGQNYKIESALLYPQIKGGEMKRYHILETDRVVIFPYENGKLLSQSKLQSEYPFMWQYFKAHQKYLEAREEGRLRGVGWYGYTRSQALSSMQQPKIVTPDYYAQASYGFDEAGKFFFFGGGAGGYGIVLKPGWQPQFVLGLLNSKLPDWYLRKISVRQYQTAFSYVKKYIEQLPIRPINLSDPTDKARHDKMVTLVEQMLDLHKRKAAATDASGQARLQRLIDSTDKEIDTLVYELYSLTPEEIAVVEKASK
jgi:hypothetical protein